MPEWKRIAIGSGAAMFVCMGLGRFSYTTMVPLLIWDGQLTPVATGYIGGFNLAATLAGAFVANFLTNFCGQKPVLTASLWMGVLALIASSLPAGGYWLGFWRSVIGFSTGIIMVQSLTLTVNSAPTLQRALAASFVFIGVGSGILFSALIVPVLSVSGTQNAWIGIAVAGLALAVLAQWGWRHVPADTSRSGKIRKLSLNNMTRSLSVLIVASFCFSFGIVPHTIFWVDFIARYLDYGQNVGSIHWLFVGVFAIAGPVAAARLAEWVGSVKALSLMLLLTGIGIGLPAFTTTLPILAVSTVLFGSQPGVSALLAATLRDLSEADFVPEL
ncbi:MAG: YbfB/YjiJ family MFS transporter, partial [Desulfobulbia bacterium]